MMVPETRQRLEAALSDLQNFLVSLGQRYVEQQTAVTTCLQGQLMFHAEWQ